ncbi:hypothetical protein BC567DRAFT_264591 [Phyllosticta citribraziliensis]
MPLAQLATIAQAGSLFTATRSLWELTRMVRNKRRQSRQTQKVEQLLDELETFVDRGVLTRKEWTSFCLQVEKSIADAEATPLEAQAQVLDFIEALENIDQEFADSEYESDTSDEGGHKSRRRRRHQRRSSEPTLHSESFSDARRSLNRSHSVQDPHAGLVPQSRGIPPMPVALPSQFQNRQLYGYGRPAFHTAAAVPPPPPPVHEDPRAGVAPTGYAMPRYGASVSTTVAPNMSNTSFAANTSRNNSLAAAYRRPRPVPHGSSLSSSNTRKVTTNSSSRLPSDPRPSHIHPGRHDAHRPASSDNSSAHASSFSSGTASPVSPIDSSSGSRRSSTSSVASSDYVLHPSRDAHQQQHSNLHHPKPQHVPAPQTDRQPRVFYFPPPPPPNAPAMAAAASAPVPVPIPVSMQVPAAPIAQPVSLRDQLIARDALLAGSLDRRVPRAGSRCSSTAGTYLDPHGEYGKRRRR